MNRIERHAIVTAGLFAVMVAGEPTRATAQGRGGAVRTPIFVAVNFRSTGESKLGIDVAEAMRQRMIRQFPQNPPRGLRVVTREQINAQLAAAGYPIDSVISTTDLRDLGRNIGADETVEGTVTRTAAGIQIKAQFYSLNNVAAPEILPVMTDKDPIKLGTQLADAYIHARKELPDYERCRGGIIGNNIDQAIDAAKAALVQYDKGVLPRACLMNAYFKKYQTNAMPIDSVIRVAQEIMALDTDNQLAIGQLADAYLQKGDTAKAIEMNVRLYRLDPSNQQQAQTTIQILASTGAPEQALPIVKEMLNNNPGDSQILETEWKLLQAIKSWKQAIATGEEMVKFDSSKADTTYFNRQIAATIADSQPALELQYLARATAKFPKSTHFWLGYSQELRRQGQLQQSLAAAKKALAIDPKIDNGYVAVFSLYVALGQSDSALAFGKLALAAGADKDNIGNALLTLISPAMNAAQASSKPEDWHEVYRISSVVDSIAPQAATAFFMSFAAFNLASGMLPGIPDIAKTDKPRACSELKNAADYITVVNLNMARGGRYNPTAAANILNAISSQVTPYIDASKKQFKCP